MFLMIILVLTLGRLQVVQDYHMGSTGSVDTILSAVGVQPAVLKMCLICELLLTYAGSF